MLGTCYVGRMGAQQDFAELLERYGADALVAVNDQGLAMLEAGKVLGEAFASYLPMAVETCMRLGRNACTTEPEVVMLAFSGRGVLLAQRAEAGGQVIYLAAWARRPPRGTRKLFAGMQACVARAVGAVQEEKTHG